MSLDGGHGLGQMPGHLGDVDAVVADWDGDVRYFALEMTRKIVRAVDDQTDALGIDEIPVLGVGQAPDPETRLDLSAFVKPGEGFDDVPTIGPEHQEAYKDRKYGEERGRIDTFVFHTLPQGQ